MAKDKGKKSIHIRHILLALSAAIANSFTFESQQYPCFDCRPTTTSRFRAAAKSVMLFSKNNIMELEDNNDTKMDRVEGYEYVHPDIAAMLLTKVCQNEPNSPFPFVVDPNTLTLRRGSQRQDGLEQSTTNIVSINLLAGLADECDRVVFSEATHHDHIPKKILGLICLSQLPTTTTPWPKEPIEGKPIEQMQKAAVLVASTVALNLLESSIRSVVMSSRRVNNKDGNFTNKSNHNARRCTNNADSKSTRGAPLLSLLIQEMSTLDNLSLDPTTVLSASDLAPILRALLLPGGINLRNLVSHGFLSTVERRWFSLTLVLIQTLDHLLVSNTHNNENEKVVCGDINRTSGEVDTALSTKTETVDQHHGTSSLTKYHPMAREVHYGKNILLKNDFHSSSTMQELELRSHQFVPSSHMSLLRFSLYVLSPTLQRSFHSTKQRDESIKNTTASDQTKDDSIPAPSIPSLTGIFTTVMCSLLEHSLRLIWCQVNNRPDDCFARPSEYYVTLDGHGQRDKHEVMISPYLGDEMTRNQVIRVIGAEACAMLSDLFAAPSVEAPNIRSAICHGTWDFEIVKELEGLAATAEKSIDHPEKSDPLLLDAACALVSCLDLISSNLSEKSRISSYRPVYSYTSTATQTLNGILCDLSHLDVLISNNSSIGNCIKTMELQQPKLCDDLRPLKIELKVVKEMACDLFPTMKKADDEFWGVDDTFSEHQTNIALSGNIVSLTLLSDASHAIKKYLVEVQERIDILSKQPSCTKERRILKSTARFCSAAMIARDFYTLTVYVSLVAIKYHYQNESPNGADLLHDDAPNKNFSREDIVKASERSRMAISTFDSHITINLDRSLKALQQYLQGKAVKKVILQKNWCDSGTRRTLNEALSNTK